MKRLSQLLILCSFSGLKIVVAQEQDLYQAGLQAYNNRDYPAAISKFSELIEKDPSNPNPYVARGDSYTLSGDPDKGIADETKAISLDPGKESLVQAYVDRSSAYCDKKMWKEAIADCQAAVIADPDSEPAYSNLSMAYLNAGNLDAGLEAAKKAMALDPNDTITLASEVQLYLKKKAYADAHDALNHLVDLGGDNPENLNEAAWILATCSDASCRDGKKAIDLATKACQITEWKDPSVIDTLAAAYAEAGDFPNAIKFENQVLASPLEGAEAKQDGQKRLSLYKANQAYRDPN